MNTTYKNILIAIDGSKEAEKAFKKAIHVAKRNNAILTIVHIVDVKAYAAVEAYVAESANLFAEDLISEYKQRAQDAGLTNIETVLEFGNPKAKIAKDIAPNHKIDLIICGATGLNAVERFLIGSVSEHIIRYAKCDVLVVRGEEAQGEF